MGELIRTHTYNHNFNSMQLKLVYLTREEYLDLKSEFNFATRYMLMIDSNGMTVSFVHVKGADMHNKGPANVAFEAFARSFDDAKVYDMIRDTVILVTITSDDKKKKWKKQKPEEPEQYYMLIPKAFDGQVKVMRTEPPPFVLDYSYVEGPFATESDVTMRLNKKRVPNFKRPRNYWNPEEKEGERY